MSDVISSQAFSDRVQQNTKRILDEMLSIWSELGVEDDCRIKYLTYVEKHVQELLKDMCQEIRDKRESTVAKIDAIYNKLRILYKELEIEMPDFSYDDVPLLTVQSKLQEKLEELEAIKEKRLRLAQNLLTKERKFCEALGEKIIGLKSEVPNADELKEFEAYLGKKETKLMKLKQNFKETRKIILKMMNEILHKPSNDFERLVIDDHENFVFSSANMFKLNELEDRISSKVEHMKEQASNKRTEIISLGQLLEIPREDYEEFLEENSGYDIETINALDAALKKYKELRMKNIGKFIIKLREDIEQWWDACKYSQEQRESFEPFYSDVFDEDNLNIHEKHLKQLKEFYEENVKLFDLFNKREEMWEEKKELDRRSEDPERFHNRGGQLLAEEKLRKTIEKKLPKMEAQLAELCDEYEARNGRPFTINGLTLEEYKHEQSKIQQAELENLKILKVKAIEEKRSAKKTPLSASRRNLTPAGTSIRIAQTTLKRKMDRSPGPSSKSMRLANSENSKPSYKVNSKVRRLSRASKKVLKLSNESKKSIRRSQRLKKNQKSPMNDTVYEAFQQHLSSKKELRSTMLSESISSSPNKAKKKIIKTPVKPLRKHCSPGTTPFASVKVISTPNSTKSPRISKTQKFSKLSVINLDEQDHF